MTLLLAHVDPKITEGDPPPPHMQCTSDQRATTTLCSALHLHYPSTFASPIEILPMNDVSSGPPMRLHLC
jgi:hypothetical protein